MKRTLALAACLLALPLAAFATGTAADRAARFQERIDQRFAAADKNGDGALTKEEAEAGMPAVYRNFDAVDANHDGFATKDEVQAALLSRMAARKAGSSTQ